MGKEPWKSCKDAARTATEYLRLRHRLIPYLYSMNYLTATEGRALCEPMYYSYDCKEAYKALNQYSFGTQLVVSPITRKTDPLTNLAYASLWVPEGETYTDVFTGRKYGSGQYRVYRDREDMPVFAKKGSIVPLYADATDNSTSPEKPLEVWVYSGDGSFVLYEDDGESLKYENGVFRKTVFTLKQDGNRLVLGIKAEGDASFAAAKRTFRIIFRDVTNAEISTDGIASEKTCNSITLVYDGKETSVTADGCAFTQNPTFKEAVTELVSRYQMNNLRKAALFNRFLKDRNASTFGISRRLTRPLEELKKICR